MQKVVSGCLAAALCALPMTFANAQTPPVSAQGTVVGTIDVRYQAAKGLLGKMTDTTRSRKWVFRVSLEQDTGVAYRVQQKLEVREGGPRPFEFSLPAGRYRFVDGVNDLSGGLESMSVPVDASFEVVPGAPVYVGRLVVQVQGKVGFALAATHVADCRDVDLPLFLASHPDIAMESIGPTRLLLVDSGSSDAPPAPYPACEAPIAARPDK
jgi:hypothetical protein